ncbi:MAG: hypothetical protein ABJC09_10785 [Terriglobia bacterium]
MLKPLDIAVQGAVGGSLGGTANSSEPLPLHLQYRFDEPGQYEIRYIVARREPDPPRGLRTIVGQSDWTNIDTEPFSSAKRTEWIWELEMPSSGEQLTGKVLPELLALPDAAALALVLPQLYHAEESVRRYAAESGDVRWRGGRKAIDTDDSRERTDRGSCAPA